jgi:hypothetical protein
MLIGEIAASNEPWIHAGAAVQAEQSKLTIRRVAARQRFEHPVTRSSMWKLSLGERAAARGEVKTAMEAAFEEDVPKSVRDIFRSLGYRHCMMGRYWFPELCIAIQLKRKRRFDRYRVDLQLALSETPPPTVTQVAQRLGVGINSLRRACPDLYTRLTLLRPDHCHFQIGKTEEALKRTFKDAPASLVQLAAMLHRNPNKLRLTYPELCADLHRQYIAHQSLERQQLDRVYQTYVRQATEEITAAGKYPSRVRVQSFIQTRNPLLTSVTLTGRALKRFRQEIVKTLPEIIRSRIPEPTCDLKYKAGARRRFLENGSLAPVSGSRSEDCGHSQSHYSSNRTYSDMPSCFKTDSG